MAPSLDIEHLGSTLMQLSVAVPEATELFLDVVPDQTWWSPLLAPICGPSLIIKPLCRPFFEEIAGTLTVEENLLSLVTAHFPAGTSNKNWEHYMQMARNGTRFFDYGTNGNLAAYGTPYPRAYNFSGYSVPSSVYFSSADKLVSNYAIEITFSLLPPSSIVKKRNLTGYGHFEFAWGPQAKVDIYNEIIADINTLEGM
ncbi:hypothetical protein PMAYCL1PPCAC_17161 [Pristionchus mayeri]|uniref:Hydrolase n=1 Tax=Pristionchus mayeri TaxID=1317129 RepID=A0AAN5I0M2_9BILA|nr:hypothetical protein PMAYCL1PPCAC_17161 [Pristionchus mayeri]